MDSGDNRAQGPTVVLYSATGMEQPVAPAVTKTEVLVAGALFAGAQFLIVLRYAVVALIYKTAEEFKDVSEAVPVPPPQVWVVGFDKLRTPTLALYGLFLAAFVGAAGFAQSVHWRRRQSVGASKNAVTWGTVSVVLGVAMGMLWLFAAVAKAKMAGFEDGRYAHDGKFYWKIAYFFGEIGFAAAMLTCCCLRNASLSTLRKNLIRVGQVAIFLLSLSLTFTNVLYAKLESWMEDENGAKKLKLFCQCIFAFAMTAHLLLLGVSGCFISEQLKAEDGSQDCSQTDYAYSHL